MAVKQGGSDVHLVAGKPLRIRLNGVLEPVRFRELSSRDMDEFLEEFMNDAQRSHLAEHLNVDFAYESDIAGRFRVNVYRHRDGLAAAFRVVPQSPPTLESLDLPAVVVQMLAVGKGLVLVTGPTGSGKAPTLAGLVNHLNHTRKGHIIPAEDPMQVVHPSKQHGGRHPGTGRQRSELQG